MLSRVASHLYWLSRYLERAENMARILDVGQSLALLSGAVVTEKVFERAGLGQLFLDAFFARDMPVVQGCVLVVAVTYVALNIAVDLLYVVVDPRVRLA